MNADCRKFLTSQPPEARAIIRALRSLIKRTVPHAVESVVWGCLSYHRPEVGGRVKGAVCQIVVKGNNVRLDFIHGVRLSDPACLLRGSQVSKRFLRIESVEDASHPDISALIRCAAELDPVEWQR